MPNKTTKLTAPRTPRNQKNADQKYLTRVTLALFARPRTVLFIWLVVLIFGIVSYTTLLRREGFPSINIPIAIVNGTYIVNDPKKVDTDLAKPISEIALKQDGVSTVQAQSAANFVNVTVQYKEGINGQEATNKLEEAVKAAGVVPTSVSLTYNVPYFGATGGSIDKIDAALSFYGTPNTADTKALVAKANDAVNYLNANKPALVDTFFVIDPFQTAVNPATGQRQQVQQTFDQFGTRHDSNTDFYNSVVIGVSAVKGIDVIQLDKQLGVAINNLLSQPNMKGYDTKISASFAPSIKESISELERVLLEGLLAVLLVGSIIIAVRASIITVLSMITVITATLGLLFLAGYTLNVITLFALILGLSLIVDDTIIMVEAIDAARRKTKTPREAVRQAVGKISKAMVAATSVAALSFLPLAFLSGVLGSFIRAIPITIITSLLISLVVALVFIPLFARVLLLGKKQMGEEGVREVASSVEAKIAHAITWPMHWARHSIRKLWLVGITAVFIGALFVAGAGMVFSKVTFNLFPPSKDTNQISVSLAFPQGTDIDKAQSLALRAGDVVGNTLKDEFEFSSYYGAASSQNAIMYIELTPYTSRVPSSKELTLKLQDNINKALPEVVTSVAQIDAGPPAAVFNTQIETEDRESGFKLANDLATYMRSVELKRVSGKTAKFTNVAVSTENVISRSKGNQVVLVSASFNGDDTTTLVTLAQEAIKKEFTPEKVASYGLSKDALKFDLGQEAENQESFKGMVVAFPIVLLVIFVLLAFEFKSLLQPLLIFMAIPFSLFGVTMSLFLTHNAFSFFVAMGFFALIGLSLKNTILVIDYANQSRRAGMGAIDAATAALEERFRPLIATSLTAVFSLIPLALTSPFWQGLAVVLIGGLLSSTFLVITVFPYYYLGGEYLRARVSRTGALLWIGAIVLVGYLAGMFIDGSLILPLCAATAVTWVVVKTRILKTK